MKLKVRLKNVMNSMLFRKSKVVLPMRMWKGESSGEWAISAVATGGWPCPMLTGSTLYLLGLVELGIVTCRRTVLSWDAVGTE